MQLQDRMIEVSSMLPSLPKLSGGVVEVLPFQGSLNIQGNGETTTQVSKAEGDTLSELRAGKRWWLREVDGSCGRWVVAEGGTEQNQQFQGLSDVRQVPVVRSFWLGRTSGGDRKSGKSFCGRGAGRPVFSGLPVSREVPDVR